MQFTGYHGTAAENSTGILSDGYILSRESEWFGRGVYFFETVEGISNGFDEAKNWIVYVKKIRNWAVFRAVMETDKYIDLLLDVEHKKLYDEIKREAIRLHLQAGKQIRYFRENTIYIKMAELDIDLIRALVDAKKDYGYYSYTVRRPQVQICVKRLECLVSNGLIRTNWRSVE